VGDPTYGYRGRYFVNVIVGWGWDEYDGKDLHLVAEAPNYENLPATIYDYKYGESYIVDFEMELAP
jgi:hypothetical protein